jgi:hypothetical protein
MIELRYAIWSKKHPAVQGRKNLSENSPTRQAVRPLQRRVERFLQPLMFGVLR